MQATSEDGNLWHSKEIAIAVLDIGLYLSRYLPSGHNSERVVVGRRERSLSHDCFTRRVH